jgi:hypothetical protein
MTTLIPELVHATARRCRTTPARALAHLSRQPGMARWILGLWDCREAGPGLFAGASLFDGARGFVQPVVDAQQGTIEYRVGATPDALAPRIRARVTPGPALGYDEHCCVVTLEAWRTADMDDARWRRLVLTHEAEIELIRAQLESAPTES